MKLSGRRVVLIFALILSIMSVYTLRLMRYQITDGAKYRAEASRTTVQTNEIVAPRGEILDRYGRVLATNVEGYTVVIEKAAFPTDESGGRNDGILALTDILAKNNIEWADTLPISRTQPYAFVEGEEAAVNTLRSTLKIKDSEKPTAGEIMKMLKERYHVRDGYSPEQERTVIGVRYEMELRGFSLKKTFTLATNLNIDAVTQISELSNTLPGVEIGRQYTRTYPNGTTAPQVVGNVSPIFANEYTALKDKGYSLDDVIGRSGIEASMEDYLRGINGLENVEIDSKGNIIARKVIKEAQPGHNVQLTIDMDLQNYLQESLPVIIQQIKNAAKGNPEIGANANAAAAVVLNIKTGEVLAMVNYPYYDNNRYYQDYAKLDADKQAAPLLNRCIQGLYRPGSAFKPCVATAGLIAGVISPTSKIKTEPYFYKGNWRCFDEAGGPTYDVVNALAVSSNFFFNTVADRLYVNGLYTKLEQIAKALGLGQKTGIELPGEYEGTISGPTEKKARGAVWYPADAAQSGIGQLDNAYTPVQLANYVATICNGGARNQVHIVKSVKSSDNSTTVLENTPKQTTDIKIPDMVRQTVMKGMLAVTESGTANTVFADFPLKIGGKTGTAQESNVGYNGVFVSFAPYEDPEIAVAVVVEHGHNGYQAAPAARDAFNYYYVHNPQWSTSTASLPDATVPLPDKSNKLLH